MRKGKKIVSTMLIMSFVLSFMMFSFTGCGDDADDKGATIGVVLPTKNEARWLNDQKIFEEQLKKSGEKYEVKFSQGDSNTERKNVEELIKKNKNLKVLIICPHENNSTVADTIDFAKSKGIKVVAYDRLITDTDGLNYYVCFDSKSVGTEQGKYLVDNLSSDTNIPLYLYAGASSDSNAFSFFEGAWEVLQPKIADGTFLIQNSEHAKELSSKKELSQDELNSILSDIDTKWEASTATEKAKNEVSSSRSKAYILAPNDTIARAVADVFSENDRDYIITGQDAEKDSVNYIIDDKQSMTVFKNTHDLVTETALSALNIIREESPAVNSVTNNGKADVPTRQLEVNVVTKENIKEILIDSDYYKESDISSYKNLTAQ